MGFWSNITGRDAVDLTAAADATFSATPPEATGPNSVDVPPEVFGYAAYADVNAPEPRVARREAIQVAAVKRCRDLIAGTIGTLPLVTVKPDLTVDRTSWLNQPERDVPRSVTMTRTAEDILFEGIAWWFITEQDYRGFPTRVVRLDPRTVDVPLDGRVYVTPQGRRGITGEYPPDDRLIRFDSPNDGLLTAGARAIRQCLTLDRAARRYSEGNPPLDYFTPADGADPIGDTAITGILNDWAEQRRKRATAYVPAALKYNLGGWNPEQLELAEQRQHAVLEVARVAGVDPEELGVSTTSRTYSNQFDRRKAFLDFTLGAYNAAIEGRLSMDDVTTHGSRSTFDLDAFLRTDALSRFTAYRAGLDVGAIDPTEIRPAEGKPALASPAPPTPLAPATDTPGDNVRTLPTLPRPSLAADATGISGLTFADPTGPAITLDAAASATFEVDSEARVIRGLAVPYNKVGVSNGQRFSFAKGTLKFSDVKRVKLWVQHDRNQAVGVATKLDDRDDGLHAEFSVARGAEGDRILGLAQDGVLDGLSIGLGNNGQFSTRDGVHHAVAVPLQEISLTPAPSFDDARLVGAFGADSGGAQGGDDLATQVRKGMLQGFADNAPRQTVSAGGPRFEVAEEKPYRFDGQPGAHEFSADVFASARGDHEAAQRVRAFMADELNPANFAAVSSAADVAALNPATNRPDMYVDRLVQATPLWQSLRKGSLTDNTPFIFPKFVSAGDLVSDHVTMVEPNTGTFVATTQTVTPSPLSGKVEIPREIVDAGGNPQVSRLIWREMERAYYEALEGKVSALLAASNPTAINLPAGAKDAALVNALEAEYAALQFAVGGFRFDLAPTHQGLYTALANAQDASGRKLLPILAPANANGTATSRFASLDVAGVRHDPVPTLAGSVADGVRKSYLLASEDVHAFASPPRELRFEFQVAHVDIGIWGYVATAISRLAGVRVINYNRVA